MKIFFLTGSIVFTVLILILAFENMGMNINGFLFVFAGISSPFFMVLGLCLLGIFTGIFYSGLIQSFLKKEDEEAPGNEW